MTGTDTHSDPGTGTDSPTIDPIEVSPDPGAPGGHALGASPFWLLLGGSYAAVVLLTFGYTYDDTFITMRFARNVLDGHGLAFNPGTPVEGFSSPLHLLVQVLVQAPPGGHDLLRAKLVSLAFGCLTVFLAGLFLRRLDLPRGWTVVACVLTGFSPMLGFGSALGLETTMVAALVAGLVLALQRDRTAPAAVFGACLALSRPEGIALVLAAGAWSLLAGRPRSVLARVRWCSWSVGAFAAYVVFRLAVFGELLPNTYFAKRAQVSADVLAEGGRYVASALLPVRRLLDAGGSPVLSLALASAMVVLAVPVVAGAVHLVRRDLRLAVVVPLVAVQLGFAVLSGGDAMRGGRFVAPVAAQIAALQVVGVVELTRLWRARSVPVGRLAAVALVASLLLPLAYRFRAEAPVPAWTSAGHLDDASLLRPSSGFAPVWLDATQLLSCARPGQLVAWSEMGYGPFTRGDLRFLDTRGLVDAGVAHAAPAGRTSGAGVDDTDWFEPTSPVGGQILRRRPEYVLTFQDSPPRALGDWVLARTLVVPRPSDSDVTLSLYRRNDIRC